MFVRVWASRISGGADPSHRSTRVRTNETFSRAGALALQVAFDLERAQAQVQQLQEQQATAPRTDPATQRREAELRQALAAEAGRVRELEGQCRQLRGELQVAQANLHAALLSRKQEGGAGPQQAQRDVWQRAQEQAQQRCGAEVLEHLAELGDLDGLSLFHYGSPDRPGGSNGGSASPGAEPWCSSSPGAAGSPGAHPAAAQPGQGVQAEEGPAERSADGELLQQRWAQGSAAAAPHAAAGALQQQVDKLQRRNTQLQLALADAHLQHSQALVALQQEVKVSGLACAVFSFFCILILRVAGRWAATGQQKTCAGWALMLPKA